MARELVWLGQGCGIWAFFEARRTYGRRGSWLLALSGREVWVFALMGMGEAMTEALELGGGWFCCWVIGSRCVQLKTRLSNTARNQVRARLFLLQICVRVCKAH